MIGSQIGPYEILEQLGQGGMGIVYKALDTQLDRIVALKFLPGHQSQDENARKRFVQEAKAASALDHVNICTIHHIGEHVDGSSYIVMSYYEGQTLKYLLSERAFTEAEALGTARQIASGLARAHAAGIVHRDIKPANVMITHHGEVKILDFGIAKLGESSELTREGSTLGTVAYMSPEQARGENVGPTSDLWSLGVLLYEMLTGKRPFDATYDQALLYAILNESPTDITSTGVIISDETAKLVNGLLAKDPAERIQTAGEVVKMLGGSTGTIFTGEAAAPRVDATSMMRVVSGFAVGGAVGLGAIYAAMMAFGLPDWIFPVGVLLLLAGAPITLYASRMERKKALLDTAQRVNLKGLAGWLTVRRAVVGGVLALAALGLVAAVYMGMRAMGIGPAATLITSGVLSGDDSIVVADFVDNTPAGNMGRPIAEALRVDLSQSRVVKLMDASTVSAALERMELPEGTTITPEVAREVAQREGLKAALIGGVSALGSSYVINLRLVDAASGSELVSLRETANSDNEVVGAVDRISASLREKIGESLVAIRQSKPLAQVTTSSFEALRLYTLAMESNERDDAVSTIGFARSAVEIDPEFASAFRLLATAENNRQGSYDRMIEYARKAYQFRERLPRREQLYATEAFYSWVEPNRDRQKQIYEELMALDPRDQRAINSLSLHHRYFTGDYQKSLEYTAQYIEYYPDAVQGYINHYSWCARGISTRRRPCSIPSAFANRITGAFPGASWSSMRNAPGTTGLPWTA
ncbi:MAG: serine/threonine-protein kinase [Rhodothermales bacterium]